MKKSTKKQSTLKTMIILAVLIILLIILFYSMLKRSQNAQSEKVTLTKVEKVLSRSLELDYPPYPKQVILYYNEILRCFYNEECTEEEIILLGEKARELYDDELAEYNEWDTYIMRLQLDIQEYQELERKITSIGVSGSTEVDYFEEDGFSFARVNSTYYILEDKISHPSQMIYLLRKDDKGRWKIYGWTLSEEE